MVDLKKVGAKITGGNGIPAGSGSFVAPLGGIRRDLGLYGAKFAESLSDSTIWRAAELKLERRQLTAPLSLLVLGCECGCVC